MVLPAKNRLSFGKKTIHVYGTPGHTPGCLSYLFPVTEGGRVHIAALFGGATPPQDPDGAAQYLRSLAYFRQEASAMGADVALSNHTALDQGLDRIAYARHRMAHMPNCYVLGQRGLETYWQVYEALGRKVLRHLSEKTEV